MKVKAPAESPEQRQQRVRAESANLRATQDYLKDQTDVFRRIKSPRVSIATGRSTAAVPLTR